MSYDDDDSDNGNDDSEAQLSRSLDDVTGSEILVAEVRAFANEHGASLTAEDIEALGALTKSGKADVRTYLTVRQHMRDLTKRIDAASANTKSPDGRLRVAQKAKDDYKAGKIDKNTFLKAMRSQTTKGVMSGTAGL